MKTKTAVRQNSVIVSNVCNCCLVCWSLLVSARETIDRNKSAAKIRSAELMSSNAASLPLKFLFRFRLFHMLEHCLNVRLVYVS